MLEGLLAAANGQESVSAPIPTYLATPDLAATLPRVLDGVRGLVPDGEVYVNQYGPIVATHVGPGALGLCVFRHTI